MLSIYGCESNDECPYTRNEISNEILNSLQKGGTGLTVCAPFYYEGGMELRKQFWSPFVRKEAVC